MEACGVSVEHSLGGPVWRPVEAGRGGVQRGERRDPFAKAMSFVFGFPAGGQECRKASNGRYEYESNEKQPVTALKEWLACTH